MQVPEQNGVRPDPAKYLPGDIDCGIGACLMCCGEIIVGARTTRPRWACTMAPESVPVSAPDGSGFAGVTAVTVPVCSVHLMGQAQGGRRRALLIAPPGARL